MLCNLKAELVRAGYDSPVKALVQVLNCTDKTARNKLSGKSPLTVPEAITIINECFGEQNFSVDYLFAFTQAV